MKNHVSILQTFSSPVARTKSPSSYIIAKKVSIYEQIAKESLLIQRRRRAKKLHQELVSKRGKFDKVKEQS